MDSAFFEEVGRGRVGVRELPELVGAECRLGPEAEAGHHGRREGGGRGDDS